MRVGELLVRAGVLSRHQVEEALRAQIIWGGRLGTNIVELHMIDLDALTRVIARQYELPAAYATHFEAADPDLQNKLSPELAAQYGCVPLRRVGTDRVVIASIAPLDGRARALVADQLGISYKGLVPAIAAELRIHYQLERVYGIQRDARFLRSRKRTVMPAFELLPDADDAGTNVPPVRPPSTPPFDGIPEELLPDFTPRVELHDDQPAHERRHYIRTLEAATPLGRIELRRYAAGSGEQATVAKPPVSLDEATLAIRRSTDRGAIACRVIDACERFVPARAMLLVVRGDAATSWHGDLAVPLDQPNVVAEAVQRQAIARAAATNPIDAILLAQLGTPDQELVIVPIQIGTHIWSLIAVATTADTALDGLEPIRDAAAVAFTRLLRNANR